MNSEGPNAFLKDAHRVAAVPNGNKKKKGSAAAAAAALDILTAEFLRKYIIYARRRCVGCSHMDVPAIPLH
jgi:DNA replicative helicase MCM subunit Mcm2 (Cdc46/Mcm family)